MVTEHAVARRVFYGWIVTAAACVTFGLAVGIPYYNIGFFYDYFQRSFGWSRAEITFGFPLAALLTVWAGPLLVPKLSPRILILVGTALTAAALLGFGVMNGSLGLYWFLWVLYTIGYVLAGPIPHQIIISSWFDKRRGTAMGIIYVGLALMGSVGSLVIKPLTNWYGFRGALICLSALMFVAWPVAICVLRDKPSDMKLFPDGEEPQETLQGEKYSARFLIRDWSFRLLLIGSVCSLGSIGAVNQHMKFVFLDQGFKAGAQLDSTWRSASVAVLWSSIVGRLMIGYLADRFSKKYLMVATYFLMAATVPALLLIRPPGTPYAFSILFGLAMGADYLLIPLVAAEQFGANTLARAMALLLPMNTIGQTWCPYFVSLVRDHSSTYKPAMSLVFALALGGALAITLMPERAKQTTAAYNA